MKENNLLIITSTFPFESHHEGSFIKEQIRYLRKEFSKVYVIAPLAYFPKILLNSKRFQHYSGYSVYPTNYSFDNVKIFFPRYLPLSIFKDFFTNIRTTLSFLAVERTIKKEKLTFDIIHAHFIWPSGYVGARLKGKYHKPLIITAHGGDIYYQPFKNSKWLRSTQHILKHSDKIITTSMRNYKIITEELSISSDKVKVVRNGFDEKSFCPMEKNMVRDRLLLPKSVKIILSVGYVVKIKGHRYLIEAMNKIVSNRTDVLCVIVGKSSKLKLQTLVEKLYLTNYVRIVEAKPHEELPLWMNACDVFVLPSLDEGFPTVIPEALGCSKPVVATSVGGVPEIIQDENIGLLVKKQNSESLSNGILTALNKEWDSEKIVEYAMQFTWDKIAKQILRIYDEMLKEN